MLENPASTADRAATYGLRQSLEWASLLRHFELGDGFALLILIVPDEYGAEICQEDLSNWLRRRGQSLYVVPASTLSEFQESVQSLPGLNPPANTGALWISAALPESASEYPAWLAAWEYLLVSWNRMRDTIATHSSYPIVLVGAPWVQQLVQDLAPDLWSIRKLVSVITPAARPSQRIPSNPEVPAPKAGSSLDPDFALLQAARLKGRKGQEDQWAELSLRAARALERSSRFQEEAMLLMEVADAPGLRVERRAEVLVALADVEYRLNRHKDGIRHAEQAASLYRELAAANPEAYLPDVAMTLNNLGNLYSATQRMKQAEGAYQEGLAIRRELAAANPEAYLPNVAATLNNLGLLYRATQRMKEAEGAYQEGLAIRRELAVANPEAYLPDVAMTLNNLGLLYRATQRMKEAEGAYQEGLAKYRELAVANPEAYLPDVAMTLNNLGNLYSVTQRMKEAEGAYQEGLAIRRELAVANPEAYLPDVAMTLNNLGNLYKATQRMKEAEGAYQEGLAIRRELAAANPEVYLPNVAATLNNLGLLYRATQRIKEAEGAYQEGLAKYRELAAANPEAYLPNVAMTLNNLGNLYKATQRMKEAEGAYQEGLAIRRELAAANPEAYLPDVAMTLNNLGNLYSVTQRMKEAEGACREAEKILRPLWTLQPELHGDQMARILLLRSGMADGAESSELLSQALAAAYDGDLRRAIENLIADRR